MLYLQPVHRKLWDSVSTTLSSSTWAHDRAVQNPKQAPTLTLNIPHQWACWQGLQHLILLSNCRRCPHFLFTPLSNGTIMERCLLVFIWWALWRMHLRGEPLSTVATGKALDNVITSFYPFTQPVNEHRTVERTQPQDREWWIGCFLSG